MGETVTAEHQSRRRRVLYDSPVSSDEFSGGGHKKTASALANTIREFEDQTRSIGLEGKWGSGKSTIVEIAKAELHAHSDKKYHVFTFDLWTNQSGSFRRAFLESLLSWLEGVDESKSTFINATRDRIRDRTVDTRTENVKIFSGFGLFVLAFIVTLPWLYSWLSPTALRANQGTPALTWVALAVISAVVIVTAAKAAMDYRAAMRAPGTAKKKVSVILSETLAVFTKDAQTVHIKQNIREADPTQNEFEAVLKGILSEFQSSGRKIIIVFDNIDRLPSDKIVEAWSDIRSVLSSRRASDERTQKLTVIVPYDRMHILRAMHSNDDMSAINKDDTFRKSFDAIFFVAPPVISDSVHFFNSKLRMALGEGFDSESAYLVYKIFALSRSDEVATPRQVIAFINAISSLWEQWGDKIPLATIAVFIVHRDKIEHNPDTLRISDSIDPRYQDLSGDNSLFKNLAALAFNVEPDLAYQVLLNHRLEEAFTSANQEDVELIASSPGFDVILPEVYRECSEKWAKDSLTQFCNAASNLARVGLSQQGVSQSKKHLLDALSHLAMIGPADLEKAAGLLSLYTLCSQEEAERVTLWLAAWITDGLPQKVQDRKFGQGRQWMDFLASALGKHAASVSASSASSMHSRIFVPGGVDVQLGAMFASAEHELDIKGFNDANISWREVAEVLGGLIENDPQIFNTIWPQARDEINEAVLPGYLERFGTLLRDHDYSESPRHVLSLLDGFIEIFEATKGSDVSIAERRSLVAGGSLYHIAHVYSESDNEAAIKARAAALFVVLDHQRSKSISDNSIHHPELGDLSDDQDHVRQLISDGDIDRATETELVEYTRVYRRLGAWIAAASGSASRNGLYKQLINTLLDQGGFVPPMPKVVAANYQFIRANVKNSSSLDTLLKLTGERSSESFDDIDPLGVPTDLLQDIADRTETGWRRLTDRVDEWLISLGQSDWEKVLGEGGRELELTRVRVGHIKIPPVGLRAPLADHVVSVLGGQAKCEHDLDYLVTALPTNSRKGVASDVLERAARLPVTAAGLEVGIKHFPRLLSQLPYATDFQTSAVKFILPAIQSATDEAIEFLSKNRDSLRKSVAIENASVRGQVQEFIGAETPEDGEDTKVRKRRLREILDLPHYVVDAPKDRKEGS